MTERSQHDDGRNDDRRATAPMWLKETACSTLMGVDRRLGRLHGPGGPCVHMFLKGCAKLQEGFHGRKGVLKVGWDELADGAFVDEGTARAIVASLVEMEEAEILDDRGWKVTLLLTGYAASQARPSMSPAAVKKRDQRANNTRTGGGHVPACPHDVPACPAEAEAEADAEDEAAARAQADPPDAAGGGGFAAPPSSTVPGTSDDPYVLLRDVVAVLANCAEPNGRKLLVEERSILSQVDAHLATVQGSERARLAMQAANEVAASVQAGTNQTSDATRMYGGFLRRVAADHRREQQAERRHGGASPAPASTVARGDKVLADAIRGDR